MQTTIGRRLWKRDGNRPPPRRLNDSTASQRGEKQTARGLPHGDSCGVDNPFSKQKKIGGLELTSRGI